MPQNFLLETGHFRSYIVVTVGIGPPSPSPPPPPHTFLLLSDGWIILASFPPSLLLSLLLREAQFGHTPSPWGSSGIGRAIFLPFPGHTQFMALGHKLIRTLIQSTCGSFEGIVPEVCVDICSDPGGPRVAFLLFEVYSLEAPWVRTIGKF